MVVYADHSKAGGTSVVLILFGFVAYTTGRFMFYSLPVLFVLVFFIFFSIVITSLGADGAYQVCVLLVHLLLVLYVLVFVLFFFLLVSGIGCGL